MALKCDLCVQYCHDRRGANILRTNDFEAYQFLCGVYMHYMYCNWQGEFFFAQDKSSFNDEIVWSCDGATSSVKYTPPSLCTPVLRQHSPLWCDGYFSSCEWKSRSRSCKIALQRHQVRFRVLKPMKSVSPQTPSPLITKIFRVPEAHCKNPEVRNSDTLCRMFDRREGFDSCIFFFVTKLNQMGPKMEVQHFCMGNKGVTRSPFKWKLLRKKFWTNGSIVPFLPEHPR